MILKCTLHFYHLPVRIFFSLANQKLFNFSDSLVRTFSSWWCQISTHASFSGCSGKFLCRLGYVKVRKVTVINILKSRRGEDGTSGCIHFSTGTVTLKFFFFSECHQCVQTRMHKYFSEQRSSGQETLNCLTEGLHF